MTETVAAVIVAAGRGERAGANISKQYRSIGGQPMIRATLRAFLAHPRIDFVQPVINLNDRDTYRRAVTGLNDLLAPVAGGATRQASVRAGLEALALHEPGLVLIHDAARPFVSGALIERAIGAGRKSGAAVPGIALADTVKSIDDSATVTQTFDRGALRIVQTPQAFTFNLILEAHRRAAAARQENFPDDAALAELTRLATLADVRTGNGFDVHAFSEGDHVMLAGIRIPHSRGVSGHSDADVALHALVDAILGALAEGDIGEHFPPSDPKWKGAASDRFLAFACERVHKRGGVIAHLDVTVVCEAPRISPHRDAMRARIAEIANVAVDRVAVKATTSEKLGFAGRGEGIFAMATATIRLPWGSE